MNQPQPELTVARNEQARGAIAVVVLPAKQGAPLYCGTHSGAAQMAREYPDSQVWAIRPWIETLARLARRN